MATSRERENAKTAMIENNFEEILDRLDTIESLLLDITFGGINEQQESNEQTSKTKKKSK